MKRQNTFWEPVFPQILDLPLYNYIFNLNVHLLIIGMYNYIIHTWRPMVFMLHCFVTTTICNNNFYYHSEHWTQCYGAQIFTWSPYPWSPVEIILCALLFVPRLIMTSQWVNKLLRVSLCGITVWWRCYGHPLWCNDVVMHTYDDITMQNDVAMKLVCYVLLCQIMILPFHQ